MKIGRGKLFEMLKGICNITDINCTKKKKKRKCFIHSLRKFIAQN